MIRRLMFSAAIAGLLIVVSCKNSDNSASQAINNTKKQADTSETIKNKKGTLLFFINPNGMPCRIQEQNIMQRKDEIEKKVSVKYIRTTDMNDREAFYQYGIRALPSLIILDRNDNIITRFTPGIHSAEKILEEISKL